jgi:hypothetical protein
MWPFGKKKEKEAPKAEPAVAQDSEVQAFAQKFLPEEFTILGVTDPTGFGGGNVPDQNLMVAGATLSAWMRDDEEEIHRESMPLITLADDRLLGFLRSHVPGNFIIKAKVRIARDGSSFQLIGMPEPGFDPDLKAFLEEQKTPVTLDGGEFGQFVLIRSLGWFDAEADWCGQSVRLTFEKDHDAQACLATARKLFADSENWDQKAAAFAASQLLEQLNELAVEAEEDEMTEEELLSQLIPDSILVGPQGGFEFWYGDGGVFWNRSLCVSGTLTDGVTDARLEG